VPARAAKPGEKVNPSSRWQSVMAQPVLPPPAPERVGGGAVAGGGGGANFTFNKKDRMMLDGDTYLPVRRRPGARWSSGLPIRTRPPLPSRGGSDVMALILRKATGDARGDDKRIAMASK